MKRNLIITGALGLVLSGMMASCASDYLDTPPFASVTSDQVGANTDNLSKAINGIALLMNFPKNGEQNGYPCGNVGEGYIMTFFGDAMGQDYYSYHFGMFESGSMIRMERFANASYYTSTDAWGYYYAMVRMANSILEKVDGAVETVEGQRNEIKAQALTYRAHAYVRLLQLYGPRWSDSNNGERKTIVLRLKETTDAMPLSTMNEVLNQIYADLDEAIALFETTGTLQPTDLITPDVRVAAGIYARAALLKEDWAKAETMAQKARTGTNIMTADEYCGGFMLATSDYLWTNSIADENILSNASWGSRNAANGEFQQRNQIGNGNINRDLYKQMNPKDIRRNLYVMPEVVGNPVSQYYKANEEKIKYVDPETMAIWFQGGRLASRALRYVTEHTPTCSNGEHVAAAYQDFTGKGALPFILFGSQLKFFCYGDSKQACQYPYMRGTEMLLTQAEAAYMQGKTAEAQQLISQLMSKRIEGFTTCTKTGQELLDEIRLQRRLELWGEGSTFFDLKRWGMNNTRRAWVENDVNSGNIPSSYAMDVAPNQANHWVLMIPRVETDYNEAIDMSELAW